MLFRTLTMTALLAVAGCDQGFGGFNEGGSSNDPDVFSDDTGEEQDAPTTDAPIITNVSLGFEDYPNFGLVLEIVVEVEDAQDDIMDGTLRFSVSEDGQAPVEQEAAIDGAEARYEGNAVIVVLRDLDSQASYEATVQVIDAAGNASEEATGAY